MTHMKSKPDLRTQQLEKLYRLKRDVEHGNRARWPSKAQLAVNWALFAFAVLLLACGVFFGGWPLQSLLCAIPAVLIGSAVYFFRAAPNTFDALFLAYNAVDKKAFSDFREKHGGKKMVDIDAFMVLVDHELDVINAI